MLFRSKIGEELTKKWAARLPGTIAPIFGVDAGRVVRGTFGSKHRLNYTVMGEAVNFSMRVCAANNTLQTQSLFTARFKRLLCNQAVLVAVHSFLVKGRAQTEQIFSLESAKLPLPPEHAR